MPLSAICPGYPQIRRLSRYKVHSMEYHDRLLYRSIIYKVSIKIHLTITVQTPVYPQILQQTHTHPVRFPQTPRHQTRIRIVRLISTQRPIRRHICPFRIRKVLLLPFMVILQIPRVTLLHQLQHRICRIHMFASSPGCLGPHRCILLMFVDIATRRLGCGIYPQIGDVECHH